ncbi:MAG: serine acetyltransferase [Lachnospiraceae bacterium]|nr:serine acetyltransferase [Lachnospiraceae bacterium]
MEKNTDLLISNILDSYEKYDLTCKMDVDAILNKEILISVLEKIREILFPGFFDKNRIRSDFARFIVGEKVEYVQYHLKKQVAKALGNLDKCTGCPRAYSVEQSEKLVAEFLNKLPAIRDDLYTDVQAAYDGDPAAYSTDEVIFCYPGMYAITTYRIAHELFKLKIPMIPRIMTEHAHSLTGIDIHPGATIGRYFFIDHGTGIVIGETTEIGEHVKIYQGVTLGALSTKKGQALKGNKRHPTLGNYVTIYANTTVLGGATVIGDNTTIGGNAFIVNSVSEGMKVSVKTPELEISGSSEVVKKAN